MSTSQPFKFRGKLQTLDPQLSTLKSPNINTDKKFILSFIPNLSVGFKLGSVAKNDKDDLLDGRYSTIDYDIKQAQLGVPNSDIQVELD